MTPYLKMFREVSLQLLGGGRVMKQEELINMFMFSLSDKKVCKIKL